MESFGEERPGRGRGKRRGAQGGWDEKCDADGRRYEREIVVIEDRFVGVRALGRDLRLGRERDRRAERCDANAE
jgi:hypothetical protein